MDATAVGGCDKRGEEEAAAAVGGAMQKRKWCVLCLITFLGEASKICEVVTKYLRNEVVRKFCANCYRTCSNCPQIQIREKLQNTHV